jgi:hypothetical protein
VAADGVIMVARMVARQIVALGRVHAHTEVTVHVGEHTLTVEHADGAPRTIAESVLVPSVGD